GEGTHLRMPGIAASTQAEALLEPAAPIEPVAPIESVVPVETVAPIVAIEPAAVATPPVIEVPRATQAAQAAAQPEAPAAQFEAGKDQRKIKDDVDRELLPVFLEEAREIIPLVSEGVRRWKANPGEHAPAAELHRHLHTLKGSARMAGLMRLGELAHVLETRVIALDGTAKPDAKAFDEIEERVDRVSLSLERLARGEDIVEAPPVDVPVAAVFEHQKDKPGAMAVMAAAAQEVASRDA